MRNNLFIAAALGAITLAACGGGGGGGSPLPSTGGGGGTTPTPCPSGYSGTAPNCVAPAATTNATAKFVHDTDGSAFAGEAVTLYPWTAGSTTVVASGTTDSAGNITLSNVPNGTYLLVGGSNSPTDTTYATVHDRVVLTGGNQTLVAPTLPTVPNYAPPLWETNGSYRIATIDPTTEAPCLTRFNSDRTVPIASYTAEPAVPMDEWSLENSRANVVDKFSVSPGTAQFISTQNSNNSSGTPGCNQMVDGSFPPYAGAYANDARVAWFGGQFKFTTTGGGLMEAPFDPRGYTDPNFPIWP